MTRVGHLPRLRVVAAASRGRRRPPHTALITHQLGGDAYGAQHVAPGPTTIRTTYSLVGLYLSSDESFAGDAVRAAHQRMGKPDSSWPAFPPPERSAGMTIMAVAERGLMADSPDGHVDAMRDWARVVWASWTDHHIEVRDLARRLGLVG